MLNNYTRGGQLFLHKIRMFKQVWDKSILVSFVIAFIIVFSFSYKQFSELDYAAGLTYIKAQIVEEISSIMASKSSSKISATAKPNTVIKDINASEVIKHPGFKRRYNQIIKASYQATLYLLALASAIFVFIVLIWSKLGKHSLERNIIKGSSILSAKEVEQALQALGRASDLKIGDMPLVKDKETSHILITGTTGSGKSNCMHHLLPQIRSKNQPAIIVDFTGEMVDRYYDPEKGDVILSLFDVRSHNWDFWKEISNLNEHSGTNINLEIVTKALFAQDDNYSDPFWQNSAEVIFYDTVNYLLQKKERSIEKLGEMLAKINIKNLAAKLKDTYSTPYLDPNNEKTAASIRSTLATSSKSLRYLSDCKDKQIALGDWIMGVCEENKIDKDSGNKGRWLFLYSAPKHREMIKPLISVWMNIIVNRIMSLGVNDKRRIWLIIDELPALKKLPSLPTALAEFRKYGGCIMAGIQSVNQLYKIYGQNEGLTMLDQFNTKFIFRTEENNFANYICKNFGEIEYQESSENFSYGAHEMRDGVSVSKQEKKKPLITPADLASLKDCEAYVKLPEPKCRVAKLSMNYVKF